MQVNHHSAQNPEIYLNILIVSKAERFTFPFGAYKAQVVLNVIGRKKNFSGCAYYKNGKSTWSIDFVSTWPHESV